MLLVIHHRETLPLSQYSISAFFDPYSAFTVNVVIRTYQITRARNNASGITPRTRYSVRARRTVLYNRNYYNYSIIIGCKHRASELS